MDRISALRNVEEALREFEAGAADLVATEQRVAAILRSYATAYDTDERHAYRARGDEAVDGTIVVARDAAEARERVRTVREAPAAEIDVERL